MFVPFISDGDDVVITGVQPPRSNMFCIDSENSVLMNYSIHTVRTLEKLNIMLNLT